MVNMEERKRVAVYSEAASPGLIGIIAAHAVSCFERGERLTVFRLTSCAYDRVCPGRGRNSFTGYASPEKYRELELEVS